MDASSESSVPFLPSQRYPDPAVQIVDQSFARYRLNSAKVERLATGFRWAEGPVWFGDGRFVLWSDIPNNRIMRWDEETGAVSVFRKPSSFANGNTRDRQGRLVTCEHGAPPGHADRIRRHHPPSADRFEGKPLNSPNDVVVQVRRIDLVHRSPLRHPGLLRGVHGQARAAHQRLPPGPRQTGKVSVAAGDINRPTASAFSPDEMPSLRGRDRGHAARHPRLRRHRPGAAAHQQARFIDAGAGTPDGFRCDVDGNIWCGWGMGQEGLDGVHVFNPTGRPIGRINLPERCANLCFGGAHRNRLFMAASTSLYHLYVNTQGAPGGWAPHRIVFGSQRTSCGNTMMRAVVRTSATIRMLVPL